WTPSRGSSATSPWNERGRDCGTPGRRARRWAGPAPWMARRRGPRLPRSGPGNRWPRWPGVSTPAGRRSCGCGTARSPGESGHVTSIARRGRRRGTIPMIEVQHLSRRYGELTAVDDVSFAIGRGEVVGLLGHNGAGKTTIMKMMTGYLEPSAGTIRIDDLRIGPDTAAIQQRIEYLPENCPVWPEMMVIDYLAYQAALH